MNALAGELGAGGAEAVKLAINGQANDPNRISNMLSSSGQNMGAIALGQKGGKERSPSRLRRQSSRSRNQRSALTASRS